MSEQKDKTRGKSRYHKERKERERRKETTIQSIKHPQTLQKVKEESPEIKVSAQSKTREEPQKQKDKFKISETSVKAEIIHRSYEVVIPDVLIAPPIPEYISIKVDGEYYIQKTTQELKIPLIQIDSPIFEFQRTPLNGEVTMRKKVKVSVKVPLLKLHPPIFAITDNLLDLTMNIPHPSKHSPSTQQTENRHGREPQRETQPIFTVKHVKPINVTTTQEARVLNLPEPSRGGAIFEEEFPDFVETLFGAGGKELREPNAAIILFKDLRGEGYIHLFEKFLLRIQREKGKAGKIKKLTLRTEDWNKEEIERWLDEGGIIFVEVTNKEIIKKLNEQDLADRLWAIFSRGDGIVVFYTKEDDAFSKMSEITQDINWNRLGLKPEIFKVIPKELPLDLKTKISRVVYGLVSIPDVTPDSKMSWIINTAEKQYLKVLKQIMKTYEPFLPVKATDNESTEHVLAKYFIVHSLIKRLQQEKEINWDKIRELIETEPETYPRPDVLYKPENEHFEFETLFGEGFRKITNKLDEYSRANPEAKVRMVVEPITALLHLQEFKHQLTWIKKGRLYSNLDVEYYTFNIFTEQLMSLEDFIKSLSEVIKESKGYEHSE